MRHLMPMLTVLLTLTACGCGGGSGSDGAGSPEIAPVTGSKLRISVTDAPFPSSLVDAASVVIGEIRVHDADSDGWTVVFDGSVEVDLIPLTGGVAMAIVEADVPPGTYDEVRMIVDAGTVELDPSAVVDGPSHTFDTDSGNLLFPSGAQTGIKLKIDNQIVVTTQLSGDLMLDFDLTRSFVFNGPMTHAPGVKRVLFTPVVRATNTSTAGTIVVDVWSDNATPGLPADDFPLAGATVHFFAFDGTETATVLSDLLGHVETSLPPDTYDLELEASGHESQTVEDIDVVLANLSDVGVVTLVATEAEILGTVMSDGGSPLDPGDDIVLANVGVEARMAGDSAVVAGTTTDVSGAFRFDALPPGDYDLRFERAGFAVGELFAVTAVAANASAQIVTLEAFAADLSGVVTDALAAPVSGAAVEVRDGLGNVLGMATTDGDGAYAISGIPSGDQFLAVNDGVSPELVVPITIVGGVPVTSQTENVQLP